MSKRIAGRSVVVVACLVVLATMIVPSLVGVGQAAPVRPAVAKASGAPQSWAYGGQEWVNVTDLPSGALYTTRVFVGYQVVTTATNTSSTVTALEVSYAYQYTYYETYCVPNCAAPSIWENISLVEWVTADTYANVTSGASVTTSHGPSSAFGLRDDATVEAWNTSETWKLSENGATSYDGVYYSGGSATAAVAFTPALGLIPFATKIGETWTATSAYSGTGGWNDSYLYAQTVTSSSTVFEHSSSNEAVAEWGNESINGTDLGPVTLANGQSATSISLTENGPYSIDYGLFLVPSTAVLFGGSNQAWSVNVLAPAAISTGTIDVAASGGNNSPSIIASTSSWSQSGQSIGGGAASAPAGSSAPSTGTSQNGTVQGQPEPVPVAVAKSQCLVGACGSASSVGPASLPSFWLIGAAAAVGVAVGIGAGLLARRPRSGVALSPAQLYQATAQARAIETPRTGARRAPAHRSRGHRSVNRP